MQDSFNPYAAPTTLEMHPAASEWLGTPNESLRKVGIGLRLIRAAVVLLILTVLLGILATVVVQINRGGRAEVRMVNNCIQIVGIIAHILNLIGSLLCLSAPPETGARGWIFASVGAELMGIGLIVAERIGVRLEDALAIHQLLAIVAFVTFILFLRKLGLFVGRWDLAQRAVNLLIIWAVLIVICLAMFAMAIADAQGNGAPFRQAAQADPLIALGVLLAMVVLALVALSKYLSLLADTRSAILTGR